LRFGLLLCFAALAASSSARALPSFNEVKSAYVPSDAWLLARDGRPLQTVRINRQVRRLPWTPLSEISPTLVRAVVVSEDKRFFEHDGVDWRAIGSSAWSNFWGGRTRGASTLTMQLAGLLDEEARRRGRRSVLEKLSQAAFALRIEGSWSKQQIVEAYLNLAGFRGELQGVAAMSRGLFGKWPTGLNERESALAAALLRSPNASPTLVAHRACSLLKEVGRSEECNGLEGVAASALAGEYRQGDEQLVQAPHLARKLLNEPGQRLKSTLDAELQPFAARALRSHLAALAKQNAQDGAVIVLNNASGEVLAWVGSSGDLSDAGEVDGVVGLRQAGSTLKPFLYALAFEGNILTPASLIEDAPLSLDTGNGLYAPQNYEPSYRGWVSARMALAGSLNVPAVKTLIRVGPEAFHARLRRFGLDTLTEDADWYGYSLALGSADVSLLTLANAYRALANGGQWSPLRVKSGSQDKIVCRQEGCASAFVGLPHAAVTPAASFLVANVLSDRAARADTFGLESWLATPYWSAAKTGTSKDMRDNWCVGFSRWYTVAVWVGNVGGDPMHDVSGVSGAAPVWRDVMDWLHRGEPDIGRPKRQSVPPSPPPGIVQTMLRFDPPYEPPRREWFVKGTQTDVVRAASRNGLVRISYPADGTIVALDPDIPPSLQRVPLVLSSERAIGGRWRMDSQIIGRLERPASWLPRPGRHRLSIEDESGNEVDAVSLEVRALKGHR
jgi:penicillin-binding protein 1C